MVVALVRRPSPTLADGVVEHIDRVPVDLDRALVQWDGYVAALRDNGWDVREVDPSPGHPDAVFVEDTVVMFRGVAVVCRAGHQSRRGEEVATERAVAALGCPVTRIEAPGTLDGGDVLKIGDTVLVGRGGRTNAEGVRQLRAHLGPLGATVVAVPVSRVLHLKTAVTALPDGTIIGYEPFLDDPRVLGRFRPVPEEHGTAVVTLGEERLLLSAAAPRTADLLADLGYVPVLVDIGEFEKLEGCVTCLSVRVRHLPEG